MIFRFHEPLTAAGQGSHGLNRGWFLDKLHFRWLVQNENDFQGFPALIVPRFSRKFKKFHFQVNCHFSS